ncbi:hypothetical protein ACE1SV_52240 [Streptomyces sennicomposti]
MSGTNPSFTRRAASAESVTPSYRRTAAYITELLTVFWVRPLLRRRTPWDSCLAHKASGNHLKGRLERSGRRPSARTHGPAYVCHEKASTWSGAPEQVAARSMEEAVHAAR